LQGHKIFQFSKYLPTSVEEKCNFEPVFASSGLLMNARLLALVLLLLPAGLMAQQNFFNVPSSEITEPNKVFLQQQLNLFTNSCVSNTTFCYGIGHEAEVGVNLLGVTYDNQKQSLINSPEGDQPVFPSFGINAQKQIEISEGYQISVGGQLLFPRQPRDAEFYGYLNNRLHIDKLKLIAGLFVGNNYYFDSETRFNDQNKWVGVQCGVEYELIEDRLYFQSDYITGRTALSNLIVGGAYKMLPQLILSAGYQFPNYSVTSTKGLVVELTYVQ
jgi:hypothetical protein